MNRSWFFKAFQGFRLSQSWQYLVKFCFLNKCGLFHECKTGQHLSIPKKGVGNGRERESSIHPQMGTTVKIHLNQRQMPILHMVASKQALGPLSAAFSDTLVEPTGNTASWPWTGASICITSTANSSLALCTAKPPPLIQYFLKCVKRKKKCFLNRYRKKHLTKFNIHSQY